MWSRWREKERAREKQTKLFFIIVFYANRKFCIKIVKWKKNRKNTYKWMKWIQGFAASVQMDVVCVLVYGVNCIINILFCRYTLDYCATWSWRNTVSRASNEWSGIVIIVFIKIVRRLSGRPAVRPSWRTHLLKWGPAQMKQEKAIKVLTSYIIQLK